MHPKLKIVRMVEGTEIITSASIQHIQPAPHWLLQKHKMHCTSAQKLKCNRVQWTAFVRMPVIESPVILPYVFIGLL